MPNSEHRQIADRLAALQFDPRDRESPVISGWVAERTLSERGTTAIVRVHHQEDHKRTPFVVKLLRPNGEAGQFDDLRTQLLREVVALRALGALGCPGIPPVITFGIETGPEFRLWYVMPHYTGGAMWTTDGRSGRWAENYRGNVGRVLYVAEVLATTLAFMHHSARRCIHGNVSVENVLLTAAGGEPILADFSNARLESHDLPDDPVGPRSWRPPELDSSTNSRITMAADIFMLGGLIYEALSGGRQLPPASSWSEPFPHDRPEYSLRRETADPRIGAVGELLRGMLARSPKNRMTAWRVARACRAIRIGQAASRESVKVIVTAQRNSRRPAPDRG